MRGQSMDFEVRLVILKIGGNIYCPLEKSLTVKPAGTRSK